jgi:hypothetical protein
MTTLSRRVVSLSGVVFKPPEAAPLRALLICLTGTEGDVTS